MPGMLYYPQIGAPNAVISQALLYWDSLSTIVPPDFDGLVSNDMRELMNIGFYRPLVGQGIYSDDEVGTRLFEATQSVPLDDLIPPSLDSKGEFRVLHVGKIGPRLTQELVHRGLAETVDAEDWYSPRLRVSPALQHVLLSVGAQAYVERANRKSGCTAAESLRLFTDERFAFNGHRTQGSSYSTTPIECWDVEIGALLPVPAGGVVLADLVAFREDYADERRRLMLAVELLLHGLRQQYDHPQDVIRLLKKELSDALCDLESAARAKRIELVRRSLAVLVSLGAAGAALKLPSAAWVLGVVGGFAINVATSTVRGDKREDSKRDYSYLLRVNRALPAKI